jgi:hypothetical protein
MFGLHGRFRAEPGQADALSAILLEAAEAMRANAKEQIARAMPLIAGIDGSRKGV